MEFEANEEETEHYERSSFGQRISFLVSGLESATCVRTNLSHRMIKINKLVPKENVFHGFEFESVNGANGRHKCTHTLVWLGLDVYLSKYLPKL